MKKPLLLTRFFNLSLFPLLFSFFSSYAQQSPTTFLKQYGGTGSDHLSVLIETADGYLLGGSSSSIPSGTKTAPNFGAYDFWIVKLDKAGNQLWDKTFGGLRDDGLSKILKTTDGGFLLAGSSSSMPSGNKTAALKSEGAESDYWIVKISSDGTKIWDKSFGGNAEDRLSDAIETPDGGFVLLGSSNSLKSIDKSQDPYGDHIYYTKLDVWVIKTNYQGIKIWDKIYGGMDDGIHGEDYGSSIVLGNDGNFVIGASSDARVGNDKSMDVWCVDCDSYNEGRDYWVIKIKPDGTKIWDKVFGGIWEDYLLKVDINPNGGYLVYGSSFSPTSGNKTIEVPHDLTDIWWMHISENGQKIQEYAYYEFNKSRNIIYLQNVEINTDGFNFSTSSSLDGTSTIKVLHYNWSNNIVWESSETFSYGDQNIAILKTINNGDLLVGVNKLLDTASNVDFFLYKYPKINPLNLSSKQIDKDVVITASTELPTSQIQKVEFFADHIKIGEDATTPYSFTWVSAPVKTSYLNARGIYPDSIKSESVTVPVSVTRTAASFYRAINFNGPQIKIGHITFESSANAPGFSYQARKFENQNIPLVPSTDAPRDRLIRSCLYSTKFTPAFFNFRNVPSGAYELYFYVWEDNYAQTFSIWINGSLALEKYNSGTAGHWEKIGPFKTTVNTGKIEIKVVGGDANISAVEIHKFAEYKEFYRAINLNGPTMKVDNLTFEGSLAAFNFSYQAKAFANQSVPLRFPPDAKKSNMIRSSLNSTVFTPAFFTFRNVPAGEYDAYIYVWEDNYSQYYSLWINGSIAIKDHFSGNLGDWDVLGPFKTQSRNGIIQIKAAGGDANISAIELWKKKTTVSANPSSESTLQSFNRVYPNPIGESLKIDLPDFNEGKTTVTISDIFGQLYLKKELNLILDKKLDLKLPLSEMKKGHYILKIQTNTESQIFKLYKE